MTSPVLDGNYGRHVNSLNWELTPLVGSVRGWVARVVDVVVDGIREVRRSKFKVKVEVGVKVKG